MSLIDGAVSFFAAALTGMGLGSGGIYLLWLTLVLGIGQRRAQGMNLLFSICALAASAAVNGKKKRIPGKTLAICLLGGLPGAIGGALLAGVVPAHWLRRILGGALVVGGITVIWGGVRRFLKKRRT